MPENCTICDQPLGDASIRCTSCGAPTDLDQRVERGARAECPRCGDVIWSHVETCPGCGARGYPALRPRFGDKSERAPETEAAEADAENGNL